MKATVSDCSSRYFEPGVGPAGRDLWQHETQPAQANACRHLPSVQKVLERLGAIPLPRPLVVKVVRTQLALARKSGSIPDQEQLVCQTRSALRDLERSRLQPVLNGTGIIIHTNLGRAPLGAAVLETFSRVGMGYSNLEYDLVTGERGARAEYVERALALLCRAEAATVVNNCAAALVLVLRHFTRRKREVLISRGELVQIGGGFRIPEILEASGARLREVGTTNKTSLQDYAKGIGPETGMLLKIHRSNFSMDGFVESCPTEALATLARRKRLPLVQDLGSGALLASETIPGLEHEPMPGEVLSHGADLVTFSGDKLLGGPQAGVLAGKAKLLSALKREPFFRALRCDKLILSALQATLELYLEGKAEYSLPVLGMLRVSVQELRSRAEKLKSELCELPLQMEIGEGRAQVGGGGLPKSSLASITLDCLPEKLKASELATRLRLGTPPVLGYVRGGRFKLDLRTIFPTQDKLLLEALKNALV